MIRIPKGTPSVNRSKLSKDELKHFRMLEMEFKQREMMEQMRMNEEHNLGLQVTAAIRQAIENPRVKTPYEQWLCDLWDKELRIDWPQTRQDNDVIANQVMENIRSKRKRKGWRVAR